jgi:hypothetical protein
VSEITAARLHVVEARRQRQLQLRHRFVDMPEPAVAGGRGPVGPRQIGPRLGRVDAQERGARGETDGIERPGLGQHRVHPGRGRRPRLARQLQRRPALAAVEAIVRQRVEQRRVVRMGRERRLQRHPALVAVAILQARQTEAAPDRSSHVDDPSSRAAASARCRRQWRHCSTMARSSCARASRGRAAAASGARAHRRSRGGVAAWSAFARHRECGRPQARAGRLRQLHQRGVLYAATRIENRPAVAVGEFPSRKCSPARSRPQRSS